MTRAVGPQPLGSEARTPSGSPEAGSLEELGAVLDGDPAADDAGAWLVVVRERRADRLRMFESALTVADGCTGTRGSLEEDGAGSGASVVVAGVYEPASGVGETLLALPSWALLRLAPGESVPPGTRVLDLRTGVVWRVAGAGGRLALRSARWACMARPGTSVMLVEHEPGLFVSEELPALERRSLGTAVVQVSRTEHTSATAAPATGATPADSTTKRTGPTADGGREQLLRVVSTATSAPGSRGTAPERPAREALEAAVRAGPRRLLEEQREWWARSWQRADVEVVGDERLTVAARTSLLHMICSATDHGEAAVGARGLTGPAYAGHVFWDADVFVLPALAWTHPARARAMLEYRIRRLPAARRRAGAQGRAGVRFPWESALQGTEVTPTSGIDPLGVAVPIRTGDQEEHITADVSWAAWYYAAVTGDWAFLDGPGRPLVEETARYWASRISVDRLGRGHLDGVIGPDEYHEDVADDAFTNAMAAWNLRCGAELVERAGTRGVSSLEAGRWRSLADSLVTGYDPVLGRHRQFAGFDALESLLVADVGSVPMAADLVVGRERLRRSQIIKQADVVMLHHLLPREVPAGSVQRDLDFYLPRTAHGSSLSPAVHAAVLARAGRAEEALEMLELAARVDLDDLTGTTAGGLHLGAMGALWQALVLGFGGLEARRADDAVLSLDPVLAPGWQELRYAVTWHGHPVRVRCAPDATYVGCDEPLSVALRGGEPVMVAPPGRWLSAAREPQRARGGVGEMEGP